MRYPNNLLSTILSNSLTPCASPHFTRISDFLFSSGINDWDSTVGAGRYSVLRSHGQAASKFYTFFLELPGYPSGVFYGSTALVGLGLLIAEVSRTHSDTPHSTLRVKSYMNTVFSSVKKANKCDFLWHSLMRVGQYFLTVPVEPTVTEQY